MLVGLTDEALSMVSHVPDFSRNGAERRHCFCEQQGLSIAATAEEEVGSEDSSLVVDITMTEIKSKYLFHLQTGVVPDDS